MNQILKTNFLFIAFFSILLLSYSCTKEEDEDNNASVKFRISEYIPYELGYTDKSEDFYYTDKYLTKVVVTQITTTTGFPPYIDKDTVQVDYDITYSGNHVNIVENEGNELIYTLNKEGNAEKCSLNEYGSGRTRYYTFTYTTEGMLSGIKEDGESIHNEYRIGYTNNDIIKTTLRQYGTDFSMNYTTNNIENSKNFPCPMIIEAYPFYFHRIAFHMGILGKLSKHLIEKSVPEGATNENTTYSYTNNAEGYVTSCTEKTTSYGSVHSREIKYTYY